METAAVSDSAKQEDCDVCGMASTACVYLCTRAGVKIFHREIT